MNATDKLIQARRVALWREVAQTRYGHRRDQVRFSCAVLIWLGGLAVLGFIVGALLAIL